MTWFMSVEGSKAGAVKAALHDLETEFNGRQEAHRLELEGVIRRAHEGGATYRKLLELNGSCERRLKRRFEEQLVEYRTRFDFILATLFDGADVSFEVAAAAGFHFDYTEGDEWAIIQLGDHDTMTMARH